MSGQPNTNITDPSNHQRMEEDKQPSTSFGMTQHMINPALQAQYLESSQMMGQQDLNKPQFYDKEMGDNYKYLSNYSQNTLQPSSNTKWGLKRNSASRGYNSENESQPSANNYSGYTNGGNDYGMGSKYRLKTTLGLFIHS